jgi:potassium efflux system protein
MTSSAYQRIADTRPQPRAVRQRRSVLLLGLLICLPAAAQQAAEGGDGTSTEEPQSAPVIADLYKAQEELQEFALTVGEIDTEAFLADRAAETAALREELDALGATVSEGGLDSMSVEALVDLQTEVRAEMRKLGVLLDELSARATRRDNQLDKLAAQREQWASLAAAARQRDAPPAVLETIARTDSRFDEVEAELKADRDATLDALTELSTLKLDTNAFASELRKQQQSRELASQTAGDEPLWNSGIWKTPFGGPTARTELKREVITLRQYFAENGRTVLLWFVGLFLLTVWLLKISGAQVEEYLKQDSVSIKASAIFRRPLSAALLAGLLGAYWLAPEGPVAFTHLIWALVPIPAAALAITVFARPIRLSTYTLAFVLVLLGVEVLLSPVPVADRLIVVVQSLALTAAFLYDLSRGNWSKAFPTIPPARLRWLVRIACLLFIAIMVTDIAGFVGVAATMKNLVFGGLGLGLIFLSASYVLIGLALALVWVRPFSGMSIVKRERWTIMTTVRKLIHIAAAVGWLITTLSLSGLMTVVVDFVSSLLGKEISIGAVTLSVSALIYGALIIYATVLVSRLVRFFMESRTAGDNGMAIGAAFAISKLLRYSIAVAGFLFAIVVMGFDLTSVTVLAGALGVGIGFGMQNIVNNFISGLILLLEQPIKVNDVTKVGDLMGTVREVGIRSTLIETFDGAEVIVPNADLISKTVLNWTKSNRRRRVEIDVGVAYGTDPQTMIELLQSVAADCEEASNDPAPMAIFTGFGDSSLNFRLYVWLQDLSNILVVSSRLRKDILARLEEADIEVPFPQRDIRVVMHDGQSPPGSAPEPVPESGREPASEPTSTPA